MDEGDDGRDDVDVRIGGSLADHVGENIGEHGRYENVSEYGRDLICHDLGRVGEEKFQTLKAELHRAFATPDSEYVTVSAQYVIDSAHARHAG